MGGVTDVILDPVESRTPRKHNRLVSQGFTFLHDCHFYYLCELFTKNKNHHNKQHKEFKKRLGVSQASFRSEPGLSGQLRQRSGGCGPPGRERSSTTSATQAGATKNHSDPRPPVSFQNLRTISASSSGGRRASVCPCTPAPPRGLPR